MVTFKVFRFEPEKDKQYYFDHFQVPSAKGMTVLEGLYYILENLDSSLAFRSSCRAAVCGSCAVHINGQYRLACNTLVEKLGRTIVIRPLAHLPVLKDLVVDLTQFFQRYESIKPYLIHDNTLPKKEMIQSPDARKKIDSLIDCILCAACYGSCPVAAASPDYLGPHALLKSARFFYDSRDTAHKERLWLVSTNKGLFRCHTIFNCQQVCPKNIDPSGAIAQLKMQAVWTKVKQILGLS